MLLVCTFSRTFPLRHGPGHTHTQVSQGQSHRRSPQYDPEQHHQRCTSLLTPKYDGACGRALHTCASEKTCAFPSCPSLCVHIHSCDLIRRPKTDFRISGRIVNTAWGYAVNIAWVYAFAAAITGARTVMDGRICENSKGGGARCRTPCKSQTSIFRLVSVS